MRLQFTIEIEIERVEGKFTSKDDIAEIVQEVLEGGESEVDGNLQGVGADGTSIYEVTAWDVSRTT